MAVYEYHRAHVLTQLHSDLLTAGAVTRSTIVEGANTLAADALIRITGDGLTKSKITTVVTAHVPALDAERAQSVNAESDRRIQAGFVFNSVRFDYDDKSQKRITGAATLAGFAAAAGAQPNDLRWHGGATDFVWIAQDNTLVPMDAPTCFAFGEAAAAWESANVFAAKAIKETSPIPANFADDALWPG